MNLNQAAHGDREFGYIQTRLGVARKTVAGHVSDPRVVREVEDWERAAAGWAAARSLRIARFGDNMRYVAVTEGDKTEAESRFGVQVNTWGVNDLADAVADASPADIDRLVEEYPDTYRVAAELLPGGVRHRRCATARPSSWASGLSSKAAASARSPPTSRIWARCGSCRGSPYNASWRRATALAQRATGRRRSSSGSPTSWARGCPGGASLMEDYTYDLIPGHERILGAHMLEVSPSLTTRPRPRGPPAGHRRQGRPCPAGVHRRPRAGRRRRALGPAGPLPAGRERGREPRRAGPAQAAHRSRGLAPGARLRDLGRVLAGSRRGAPHRDEHSRRGRGIPGLRRDRRDRAACHRRRARRCRVSNKNCGGTAPTTGSRKVCDGRPRTRPSG